MTKTSVRKHIHPFPARMAPDIALEKITDLRSPRSRVLDPMCGSGTVVRLAAEAGHEAIGSDLDPMAVMLTRSSSMRSWTRDLERRATALVAEANGLDDSLPSWVRDDEETANFVAYWFAPEQVAALSRLGRVLALRPRRDDPLRVALSRLIVTKDGGASLARDTAHSRPHRTRDVSDFDVMGEFVRSAAKIASAIGEPEVDIRPQVRRADARTLRFVPSESVDLVVTSPPYLNAIDYLRGHRMSLVWLGWTSAELRTLRGETVGAERGLTDADKRVTALTALGSPGSSALAPRYEKMVHRFTKDVHDVCRALRRVVKRSGTLVLVVADSRLRGTPVSNSGICRVAAQHHGFKLVRTETREIPARHRYLPPPGSGTSTLANRMKEEIVLTFSRQ